MMLMQAMNQLYNYKTMKKTLIYQFNLLTLLLISTIALGQNVSTTTQTFGGESFGGLILVPINTENITSYGDIWVATIRLEFEKEILVFEELTNINAGFSSNFTFTTSPDGSNGAIQFNIEATNGAIGQPWSDGKLFDLRFTYHGGYTVLDIKSLEFMSGTAGGLLVNNPPSIDGSISGTANITGSDGDYNTKGTWTGEFGNLTKPGPGHNVTITSGGTVTIDADATANTVTIADGGNLTQNAVLAVTGDFTVQSGGSFLQNGTLTAASTTAERALPAANWADPTDGWNHIASPVANQAIDGDWITSGAGNDYDFYAWDEPFDLWRNQKHAATSGYDFTSFNVGQGYMVAYQAGGTKTFSGVFNTTDVATTLTKQGTGIAGDYVAGANLLGNPYPAALTWDNSWIPAANVQATAYIWSGSAYAPIVVGDVIPATYGFMVLATNDQAITMPAAARTHIESVPLKATIPGIKLIANDLEVGSQQETHIKFNPQATEAYDLAYDAFYMSGYAPQFYTMADQSALMVNSLSTMQDDIRIPLYFEKTEAESFSIQLTENNLGSVYLKDLKTNTTVKLSETMEYYFSAEAGDSPERFEVFFSPLGVDELAQAQAGAYVRNNNSIVVYGLNGATNVELYNLAGQLVYASQTSGSTSQFEINAGLKQGVYIVKLSNQAATNSVKVFIR